MGPRFSWLSLTLLACGVASGCAATTPSNLPPGVTVAPDGVGFCCPAGTPSCNCRSTGGHVEVADQCDGTYRTCDVPPSLWQLTTDAHGCRRYTFAPSTPDTRSCFPEYPDTGSSPRPDVSFVDAGPDIDANIDAALPANITPAPDGMGFCCAPATPSCDCQPFGGHAETVSECAALPRWCDVHPDDWMPVTDVHGCSFYTPPPFHTPGRSCFPDVQTTPLDAGPG